MIREIQEKYNEEHNITPKTIMKAIKDVVTNKVTTEKKETKMTKKEKIDMIARVEEEMKNAAKNLDFERAMELRDILFEMKSGN